MFNFVDAFTPGEAHGERTQVTEADLSYYPAILVSEIGGYPALLRPSTADLPVIYASEADYNRLRTTQSGDLELVGGAGI